MSLIIEKFAIFLKKILHNHNFNFSLKVIKYNNDRSKKVSLK